MYCSVGQVHHSKTTKQTSYNSDFKSLIEIYTKKACGISDRVSVSKQGSLKRDSERVPSILKVGLSQLADSRQSSASVAFPGGEKNQSLGKELIMEGTVILSDDDDKEEDEIGEEGETSEEDSDEEGLTVENLEEEAEERFGGDYFGTFLRSLDSLSFQ